MKFTVELKPFIKIIQAVAKKMPSQKRTDPDLRIYACQGRVFVEANSTVAGTQAVISANGGCTVPRAKFFDVLKTYEGKKELTISADQTDLKIENFALRHTNYSPTPTLPANLPPVP